MKIIAISLIYVILAAAQNAKAQHSNKDSISLSRDLNRLIEKYKTPDAAFVVTQNSKQYQQHGVQ